MKRRFHFHSIRAQLFAHIAIILCVSFLLMLFAVTAQLRSIMADKMQQDLSQQSITIENQMNRLLNSMESITRQIQYSTAIKSQFYQYINATNPYDKSHLKDNLRTELSAILNTTKPSITLLNVQSIFGDVVSVGGYTQPYITSLQAINSYQTLTRARDESGAFNIFAPHYDSDGRLIISAVCFFTDPSQIGFAFNAFVEVRQSYEKIEKIVHDTKGSTNIQTMIMDANGQIIYPYGNNYRQRRTYDAIKDKIEVGMLENGGTTTVFRNDDVFTQLPTVYAVSAQGEYDYTVVVYETEASFMGGIRSIYATTAILTIILLVAALMIAWHTATNLTTPISELRRSVKSINFETLQKTSELHFEHHEYDDLQSAFHDMLQQLHASFEQTLQMRQQEMQTRLYVLQSKMDPHFLNNALALIQIYARKDDMDSIKEICLHLSGMMHYLYRSYSEMVCLHQEIAYTDHYLQMMQSRYLSNMQYSIDVHAEMMELQIPKLIVQPLVENCFKHGMLVSPPWIISIRGYLLPCDRFCIEVEDNGIGFSEQVKNALLQNDFSQRDKPDTIDGIGLINIFSRLRLIYGEKAIIQIESLPGQGALVRIGGAIPKKET